MTTTELLALLRDFYNSTVNDDSTCCFGCGCVDVERIRARVENLRSTQQDGTATQLEKELAAVEPKDSTHTSDCIIQRARAILFSPSVVAMDHRREQLHQFLKNGATLRMLSVLFPGTNHLHVSALRKELGITNARSRPPLPKEQRDREAIEAWWWKNTDHKDTVENYVALRVKFPQWGYGTLFYIIHELETPDAMKHNHDAGNVPSR